MSSLHQSHYLPWDNLTRHLSYLRGPPASSEHRQPFLHLVTGPTKHVHDAAEREKLREFVRRDFAHFARALRNRIEEFSATERIKIERMAAEVGTQDDHSFSLLFEARPDLMEHSNLYTELKRDMARAYPRASDVNLNTGTELSRFEWWVKNFRSERLVSRDMAMADVIKHLLNVDTPQSLVTLRRLAHYKGIEMQRLIHLSYGHHYGWSRIGEHALRMYIVLNILIDKDLHCSGIEWLRTLPGWRYFENDLTDFYDGCEQNVPDRAFFANWKAGFPGLGVLKTHLKKQFRRLYLYDWLVKDCHGEVDWFRDITAQLSRWCDRQGRGYIMPWEYCWKEASPKRRIGPCPASCAIHGL